MSRRGFGSDNVVETLTAGIRINNGDKRNQGRSLDFQ